VPRCRTADFFEKRVVAIALAPRSVDCDMCLKSYPLYLPSSCCAALCLLLVYRVCHHRQHQVIPPLPRLAGPPAPSYRWINEIGYGDLLACTPSYCYCTHQCGCSTVHSTALLASMCCNGVNDAYAVCMEDTIALLCDRCMRVAADEVWLGHTA